MFISKSLPYLALGYLLALSCNSPEAAKHVDTTTVKTNIVVKETDSVDILIHAADSVVKSIKAASLQRKDAFLPPAGLNDTLFVQFYFKDKVPFRLNFTTFEDDGKAYGSGNFYFSESFPLIMELRIGDTDIYSVLTRDGKYFSFFKSAIDQTLRRSKLPIAVSDYMLGSLLKSVNDLIQLYPDFRFSIAETKLKGDFKLRVTEPLGLYAQADTNSTITDTLPKGIMVGYLQSSRERVYFRGKTWVWYQVKSNDKTGWIVGHPDFVEEMTDENAD